MKRRIHIFFVVITLLLTACTGLHAQNTKGQTKIAKVETKSDTNDSLMDERITSLHAPTGVKAGTYAPTIGSSGGATTFHYKCTEDGEEEDYLIAVFPYDAAMRMDISIRNGAMGMVDEGGGFEIELFNESDEENPWCDMDTSIILSPALIDDLGCCTVAFLFLPHAGTTIDFSITLLTSEGEIPITANNSLLASLNSFESEEEIFVFDGVDMKLLYESDECPVTTTTITIPSFTVDSLGRLLGAENIEITIPSSGGASLKPTGVISGEYYMDVVENEATPDVFKVEAIDDCFPRGVISICAKMQEGEELKLHISTPMFDAESTIYDEWNGNMLLSGEPDYEDFDRTFIYKPFIHLYGIFQNEGCISIDYSLPRDYPISFDVAVIRDGKEIPAKEDNSVLIFSDTYYFNPDDKDFVFVIDREHCPKSYYRTTVTKGRDRELYLSAPAFAVNATGQLVAAGNIPVDLSPLLPTLGIPDPYDDTELRAVDAFLLDSVTRASRREIVYDSFLLDSIGKVLPEIPSIGLSPISVYNDGTIEYELSLGIEYLKDTFLFLRMPDILPTSGKINIKLIDSRPGVKTVYPYLCKSLSSETYRWEQRIFLPGHTYGFLFKGTSLFPGEAIYHPSPDPEVFVLASNNGVKEWVSISDSYDDTELRAVDAFLLDSITRASRREIVYDSFLLDSIGKVLPAEPVLCEARFEKDGGRYELFLFIDKGEDYFFSKLKKDTLYFACPNIPDPIDNMFDIICVNFYNKSTNNNIISRYLYSIELENFIRWKDWKEMYADNIYSIYYNNDDYKFILSPENHKNVYNLVLKDGSKKWAPISDLSRDVLQPTGVKAGTYAPAPRLYNLHYESPAGQEGGNLPVVMYCHQDADIRVDMRIRKGWLFVNDFVSTETHSSGILRTDLDANKTSDYRNIDTTFILHPTFEISGSTSFLYFPIHSGTTVDLAVTILSPTGPVNIDSTNAIIGPYNTNPTPEGFDIVFDVYNVPSSCFTWQVCPYIAVPSFTVDAAGRLSNAEKREVDLSSLIPTIPPITQASGTSEDSVMSQKAVTEAMEGRLSLSGGIMTGAIAFTADTISIHATDSGTLRLDARSYTFTPALTDSSDRIATTKFVMQYIHRLEEEVSNLKKKAAKRDEEAYMYGVEWDNDDPSPECTRIGNMDLHKTLPIQNAMRGCLLADDGTVVEYLPDDDWTSSVRDGSRGQVMVELPEYYVKFETEGSISRVKMSTKALEGYTHVGKMYAGAYRATIETSPIRLCSVVNEDCPMGISMNEARFWARNRHGSDDYHWNQYTYDVHRTLCWFFVVKYATLNSQKAFVAELDANGYRQGGLGEGVTNTTFHVTDQIPCGYTDALGNRTGVMEKDSNQVNRYRGVELPFGFAYLWTDGMVYKDGIAYYCNNPANYSSESISDYKPIGTLPLSGSSTTEGSVRTVMFNPNGHIIPGGLTDDATFSTYFSDYACVENTTYLVGVIFGGIYSRKARCGLFNSDYDKPSKSGRNFNSRLCYIP